MGLSDLLQEDDKDPRKQVISYSLWHSFEEEPQAGHAHSLICCSLRHEC
jgi:hypothetical protein